MKYPESEFNIISSLIEVSKKANILLQIPEQVESTCCGTPFSSKGYKEANAIILNDTIEKCWEWSKHGTLTIICDTSPCSYSLKNCSKYLNKDNLKKWQNMQFLDIIEYTHDHLLPKLNVSVLDKTTLIHPVCSVEKMGLTEKLQKIVNTLTASGTVPLNTSCCGFAGDRGFSHPELTSSALEAEAKEINLKEYDFHISSSFTCELGLSRKTEKPFTSIIELIDKAS